MASPPPAQQNTVSECHLEIDLIFESSDGKQFGVHSANLESFSAGFPPANLAGNQELEVVKMKDFGSESMPLFLQFMHHVDQPALDNRRLDMSVLMELANGSEKYHLYAAKQPCRLAFKVRMHDEPAMALLYFSQHGLLNEADSLAKWTIGNCSKHERDGITSKIRYSRFDRGRVGYAWEKYQNSWRDRAEEKTEEPNPILHKGGIEECSNWRKFRNVVAHFLRQDPIGNAQRLSAFIDGEYYRLKDCKWCIKRADKWGRSDVFSYFNPSFSSFL